MTCLVATRDEHAESKSTCRLLAGLRESQLAADSVHKSIESSCTILDDLA